MYINAIGYYVPQRRVTNDDIKTLSGLESDWIVQRTGIHTRSRISDHEDVVTMGADAIKNALPKLPYAIEEVDLIVSAGYVMTDTVGTVAHRLQRQFGINHAQAFAVTSACSSFVNAVEIVQGYFAMGKASKALVVCSEANSLYNDYSNPQSGHLWGDAAVAVFFTNEKVSEHEPQVLDVLTKGLGGIGKGPDGVCLFPQTSGITMKDGRDVFHFACTYMPATLEELLQRNALTLEDVAYFACHQANMRIVANIMHKWKMNEARFFNNIQELGNTGSASAMLALAQNVDKVKKGELVGMSVFGGGYSSGAVLIRF